MFINTDKRGNKNNAIYIAPLVEFTVITRLDLAVTDGLPCDIRHFVTALRLP